jgi:hypothetical protein
LTSLLAIPALLVAQPQCLAQGDKVAAVKQHIAENQKQLAQYQWVETTTVSLKGEQKSQTQKACHYGPDGKVQKQPITAPAQQSSPRGLRGRIVAKKKEEMTDYMKNAAALIHEYVPPDSQRIDSAKNSGNIALKPGANGVTLEITNYLKPGDMLSLNLANDRIQKIHVATYLDSQKDAITLDTTFASLTDGTSYPSQSVLVATAKNIQVVVQNSNYQKMMAAAPSQQSPQGGAAEGIDSLTASNRIVSRRTDSSDIAIRCTSRISLRDKQPHRPIMLNASQLHKHAGQFTSKPSDTSIHCSQESGCTVVVGKYGAG